MIEEQRQVALFEQTLGGGAQEEVFQERLAIGAHYDRIGLQLSGKPQQCLCNVLRSNDDMLLGDHVVLREEIQGPVRGTHAFPVFRFDRNDMYGTKIGQSARLKSLQS